MFPDYNSPDLHLAHPTPEEKLATWNLNYEEWGKALSKSDYLHREQYLASVPLTSDDGMTYWCLVDKNAPPNSREIYASCESLRKRAFISRKGKVEEVIIHSVGSVFCPPKNRGHRYASRMMSDLGSILRTWQLDPNIPGRSQIPASILFSDIGKKFYANHGWLPFPSSHIALPPIPKDPKVLETSLASPLKPEYIPVLCALDVQYIRRVLERASDDKTHIALLPDHATIQWHHLRENIMSTPIFGHAPEIKGAIAGSELGSRVWAYWTRGYYNPIDSPNSSNCLHILRLVIEDEVDNEENARNLESVLRYAQMEAGEWKMKDVQFWNPTRLVEQLLDRSDLGGEGAHQRVEREEESVASLMWYGEGEGTVNELEWVGNEKYGWC